MPPSVHNLESNAPRLQIVPSVVGLSHHGAQVKTLDDCGGPFGPPVARETPPEPSRGPVDAVVRNESESPNKEARRPSNNPVVWMHSVDLGFRRRRDEAARRNGNRGLARRALCVVRYGYGLAAVLRRCRGRPGTTVVGMQVAMRL